MHNVKKYILKHWGLLLIVMVTVLIIITNIQPKLYMMGWDNFSISLDPVLNLQRTLTVTWREYRGMGVQSDSEVVDLARQALYVSLGSVLPKNLLEQIFVFLNLIAGTVGMFFLAKLLYEKKNTKIVNEQSIQSAATCATLFYLFNLNTLATFYLPMAMFVARYGGFPLIIYFYLRAVDKFDIKNVFYFSVISLAAVTAYLTATVFVTLGILLGVLFIFYPNKKTQLKLLAIFLLLNAFWTIPFTHYAINKAQSVVQASTNIETNEIQQNKSPFDYTWYRVFVLMPEMVNPKITNLQGTIIGNVHPLINKYDTHLGYMAFLLLFPVLYSGGFLIAVVKKNQYIAWAGIVTILMLLFSRGYYPPFGYLYALATNIPFFESIFRFPDTKFYPLIAFTGAILAGYAVFVISEKVNNKKIMYILLAVLVVGNMFVYRSYIKRFIDPLLFVKVPNAYFEIANMLNADGNTNNRVIHLPNEKVSYWKPYEWGYYGSSFFTFMLNKPLVERTFEPGSLENDYINSEIARISINAQASSEIDLAYKTNALYEILRNANVRYIIFDDTVNNQILSRGKLYWGKFYKEDNKALLDALKTVGLATQYSTNVVDIQNYLDIYQDTYPLPLVATKEIEANPQRKIDVLSLVAPQYKTFESYKPVKSLSTSLFNEQAVNVHMKLTEETIEIALELPDMQLQKVAEAKIAKENLQNTTSTNNVLSDWHTYTPEIYSDIRVNVGNVLLGVPTSINQEYSFVTAVLTDSESFDIDVYTNITTDSVELLTFEYTDNPNCFEEFKLGTDYDTKLDIQEDYLDLTVANGSACVISENLTSEQINDLHNELEMTYYRDIYELETAPINTHFQEHITKSQNEAFNFLSSLRHTPYMSICLIDSNVSGCINNHSVMGLQGSDTLRSVTIPNTNSNTNLNRMLIAPITVGKQAINLKIQNIKLKTFEKVYTNNVTLKTYPKIINRKTDEPPTILATSSYFYNPSIDALLTFNTQCLENHTLRLTKQSDNVMYSYIDNCDNGFFIPNAFETNGQYLLQTNFSLMSGKYPRFAVDTQDVEFKDTPFVKEIDSTVQNSLKKLQKNEVIPNEVETYITSSPLIPINSIIKPATVEKQVHNVLYAIKQNNKNQGIFKIDTFNIYKLPNTWEIIESEQQATKEYDTLEILSEKRILSSLWKVKVKTSPYETYLLEFNQGYDEAWGLYKGNIIKTWLGINKVDTQHLKVNDLYNGWEISSENIGNGEQELYVFYSVERLGMIGKFVTLLVLGIIIVFYIRYRRKN